MSKTIVLVDANSTFDLQQQLGQRLQEAKTKSTALAIQEAMGQFCGDLLDRLRYWVGLGKRAAFAEGCLLYWVETYWSELTPLHDHYESFFDFAAQESNEDYSTWRTKINMFRTFVLNETNNPMVAEKGGEAFMDVPVGKLQKALGAVRKGDITETQMEALLDPGVNDRQFHHVMKALPEGTTREEQERQFIEQGGKPQMTVDMAEGTVTFWPGGGTMGIKIGWLDVRNADPTVKEWVDKVIDSAGIQRR